MNNERKEIVAGRGFYYMPAAYVTLKVTVEGIYNHEEMKKAVSALEEVHPIINNVVRKEGDNMWFEDVGKHVPILLYEEEQEIKWEDAILDMTREPITELSERDLPLECKIPEELRARYITFNNTCREKQIAFSWENYKQMIDTHNAVVGTGVTCRNIKGTAYRNLRGKCKELGVTVNSVLTTAIAAAMQKGECVDAIVAVNTRPLFDYEERNGLANFASCVQPTVEYDSSIGFWANVILVDEKIKTERFNKQKMLNTLYTFMLWGADAFGVGYYARYGLFRDMEVLMELRKTLGLNSEADTFDISNIGSVEYDANSEDFVVRDCYFIPNLMPACACTFGVVSLGNILTISLGYKKNLVSDEEAKKILAEVISRLTE